MDADCVGQLVEAVQLDAENRSLDRHWRAVTQRSGNMRVRGCKEGVQVGGYTWDLSAATRGCSSTGADALATERNDASSRWSESTSPGGMPAAQAAGPEAPSSTGLWEHGGLTVVCRVVQVDHGHGVQKDDHLYPPDQNDSTCWHSGLDLLLEFWSRVVLYCTPPRRSARYSKALVSRRRLFAGA